MKTPGMTWGFLLVFGCRLGVCLSDFLLCSFNRLVYRYMYAPAPPYWLAMHRHPASTVLIAIRLKILQRCGHLQYVNRKTAKLKSDYSLFGFHDSAAFLPSSAANLSSASRRAADTLSPCCSNIDQWCGSSVTVRASVGVSPAMGRPAPGRLPPRVGVSVMVFPFPLRRRRWHLGVGYRAS